MKFTVATPIQAAAIPLARQGRDIIGCAQTGTGKTAAFCIPLVAKLMENPGATALVLAPTRELALQISDVLRSLTIGQNLRTALLIGGTDMYKQTRDLSRKPAIIVATPGRLNDHLRRKSVDLKTVQVLVLDEGDRMLDMGFEQQINDILKFIGPDRQTLLFSATFPDKIRNMAKRYMKSPEFISVGQISKPVEKVRHSIIHTTKAKRNDILLDQLNTRKGSVLIFVNTKHGTNRLATYLEEYGYDATRIHGGRTQGQRNQALAGFRAGKFRIMVATDVAARGLDIPHIAHVINYDLPIDLDDYVHRIGRTARAGAEGEAICLLSPEEHGHWNRIARINNLEMLPGKRFGGGSDRDQGSVREQFAGRRDKFAGKRDRFDRRDAKPSGVKREAFPKPGGFAKREGFAKRDGFEQRDKFAKREGFEKRDNFPKRDNFVAEKHDYKFADKKSGGFEKRDRFTHEKRAKFGGEVPKKFTGKQDKYAHMKRDKAAPQAEQKRDDFPKRDNFAAPKREGFAAPKREGFAPKRDKYAGQRRDKPVGEKHGDQKRDMFGDKPGGEKRHKYADQNNRDKAAAKSDRPAPRGRPGDHTRREGGPGGGKPWYISKRQKSRRGQDRTA
ncbi:MAG: DEAD/DEAH box helicase [Bdellovibrionia bacterium]